MGPATYSFVGHAVHQADVGIALVTRVVLGPSHFLHTLGQGPRGALATDVLRTVGKDIAHGHAVVVRTHHQAVAHSGRLQRHPCLDGLVLGHGMIAENGILFVYLRDFGFVHERHTLAQVVAVHDDAQGRLVQHARLSLLHHIEKPVGVLVHADFYFLVRALQPQAVGRRPAGIGRRTEGEQKSCALKNFFLISIRLFALSYLFFE